LDGASRRYDPCWGKIRSKRPSLMRTLRHSRPSVDSLHALTSATTGRRHTFHRNTCKEAASHHSAIISRTNNRESSRAFAKHSYSCHRSSERYRSAKTPEQIFHSGRQFQAHYAPANIRDIPCSRKISDPKTTKIAGYSGAENGLAA
jgi:hypothetical protein